MTHKLVTLVLVEAQTLFRKSLSETIEADAHLNLLGEFSQTRAAVKAIPALQPDVVLIAVGYPGLAELEAISTLRHSCPNTRIAALLTEELAWQAEAAREHGASYVLSKAAPRPAMLKALQSLGAEQPLSPGEVTS